LDIDAELEIHSKNKHLNDLLSEYNDIFEKPKTLKKTISEIETKLTKEQNRLSTAIVDKKCYACGQGIDENH